LRFSSLPIHVYNDTLRNEEEEEEEEEGEDIN
jgi:hypothetical protein